jgi:hypothetical protein
LFPSGLQTVLSLALLNCPFKGPSGRVSRLADVKHQLCLAEGASPDAPFFFMPIFSFGGSGEPPSERFFSLS